MDSSVESGCRHRDGLGAQPLNQWSRTCLRGDPHAVASTRVLFEYCTRAECCRDVSDYCGGLVPAGPREGRFRWFSVGVVGVQAHMGACDLLGSAGDETSESLLGPDDIGVVPSHGVDCGVWRRCVGQLAGDCEENRDRLLTGSDMGLDAPGPCWPGPAHLWPVLATCKLGSQWDGCPRDCGDAQEIFRVCFRWSRRIVAFLRDCPDVPKIYLLRCSHGNSRLSAGVFGVENSDADGGHCPDDPGYWILWGFRL